MTVPEIIGKSALEIFTKIKARLDNGVTGVKGDRESAYRTGNVNLTPANIGAVPASAVGAANGVAELDGAGKVLSSQLPSYVDDVLEFASLSAFPATGEGGKIYVAIDTNLAYRWSGSAYVEISPSIALGETSSTAYRGDRGKAAYDHAQMTSGNPHSVTKSDVGLGNVDNTSDADKPVSTAQRAALDAKADASDVSALQAENAVFREYFANMEVYRTASGNPATFSDGYAANLMELVVTLAPTQSGSGDPSPTNVRPIAGATSVTVTRSGEGGANEITVTVPLVDSNSEALTVYGGTLNVTTGELAVTAKYKTLAEWGDMYWHSGGKSFILPVGDIKRETPFPYGDIRSSAFKAPNQLYRSNDAIASNVPNHAMATQGGLVLYVRDDDYNGDVSAFKAAFGDAQIVYPLATPVTYQLTSAQVAALAGYNAVAADSGTLSLTYRADPNLSLGEPS